MKTFNILVEYWLDVLVSEREGNEPRPIWRVRFTPDFGYKNEFVDAKQGDDVGHSTILGFAGQFLNMVVDVGEGPDADEMDTSENFQITIKKVKSPSPPVSEEAKECLADFRRERVEHAKELVRQAMVALTQVQPDSEEFDE